MATIHPAVIWLIIAAVVGVVLLIATIMANRKKTKKGKFVVISFKSIREQVNFKHHQPFTLRYVSLSIHDWAEVKNTVEPRYLKLSKKMKNSSR